MNVTLKAPLGMMLREIKPVQIFKLRHQLMIFAQDSSFVLKNSNSSLQQFPVPQDYCMPSNCLFCLTNTPNP